MLTVNNNDEGLGQPPQADIDRQGVEQQQGGHAEEQILDLVWVVLLD